MRARLIRIRASQISGSSNSSTKMRDREASAINPGSSPGKGQINSSGLKNKKKKFSTTTRRRIPYNNTLRSLRTEVDAYIHDSRR